MYQGNILILGFNFESADKEGVAMNYKHIQNQFPTEIDLCGLIKFGCSDAAAHLQEIFADVDVTDNPILLTCDAGCENLKAFFCKNGKLEAAEFEVMPEEELYRSFSFVRLRFDLREYVDDLQRIPEIMQERRKYVGREPRPYCEPTHLSLVCPSSSWPLGDCALISPKPISN